jgi:hypothetical protein
MNKGSRPRAFGFFGWLLGGAGAALLAVAVLNWMPDSGKYRNQRPGPSGQATTAGLTTAGSADTGSTGTGSAAGATAGAVAGSGSGSGSGSAEAHKADEFSLPALQKLVGRWRRRDADYVLKVDEVDARGDVRAAYLNPNPIQVGKASAHSHGDAAHLTVELRDFNYPGCIYDLNYDPKSGTLRGTYFQAALGETYDVEFVRAEGS